MTSTPTFDPAAYKTTTRDQWERAAEAWHRWGPTLEAWLGPATALMLDLAAVAEGSRVLDIAAGAGGQTLAAARRGGPARRGAGPGNSPGIPAHAPREAHRGGAGHVPRPGGGGGAADR